MKPYIFLALSVFVFSHLNAQTLQVRVVDSNGEATLTIPTEITYNGKVIDNSTIDMTLKDISFHIVN